MRSLFLVTSALVVCATAGVAHANIPYKGGPIVKNARVRVVFLGDAWIPDPRAPDRYPKEEHDRALDTVTDFFNRRQFYDPLREYCGSNGCVDTGSLDSVVTIPFSFPVGGTPHGHCSGYNPCARPDDIRAVLQKDAANIRVDSNLVYEVLLPDREGDSGITFDVANAAGVHYDDLTVNGVQIPYAIVNSVEGATIAHEVSEMLTDPFPNTRPAFHQDSSDDVNEIGDVCTNTSATLDGIPTQMEWSNSAGKCVGYAAWPQFAGPVHASDGATDSSFVVFERAYGDDTPDLYAIAPDNGMRYKRYTSGNDWAPWLTPPSPTWVTRIAAASWTSGNDLVGIGGGAQALWWRPAENIFDFGWAQVSDFGAADVKMVRGGSGRGTILALGQDGKVRYQYLDSAGNPPSVGNWGTLDGLPGNATVIAATTIDNIGYVVAAANGSWPLYMAHEYVELNPRTRQLGRRLWTSWVALTPNQQPQGLAAGVYPRIADIALGATSDQRLAVFVATDVGVLRTFDTRSNSWGWAMAGLPLSTLQIAVAANGDGRLELYGVDGYGHVWQTWQSSLDDAAWGGPYSRGGHLTSIAAITHPTGAIEVFGVDADTHQIAHDLQNFSLPGYWVY